MSGSVQQAAAYTGSAAVKAALLNHALKKGSGGMLGKIYKFDYNLKSKIPAVRAEWRRQLRLCKNAALVAGRTRNPAEEDFYVYLAKKHLCQAMYSISDVNIIDGESEMLSTEGGFKTSGVPEFSGSRRSKLRRYIETNPYLSALGDIIMDDSKYGDSGIASSISSSSDSLPLNKKFFVAPNENSKDVKIDKALVFIDTERGKDMDLNNPARYSGEAGHFQHLIGLSTAEESEEKEDGILMKPCNPTSETELRDAIEDIIPGLGKVLQPEIDPKGVSENSENTTTTKIPKDLNIGVKYREDVRINVEDVYSKTKSNSTTSCGVPIEGETKTSNPTGPSDAGGWNPNVMSTNPDELHAADAFTQTKDNIKVSSPDEELTDPLKMAESLQIAKPKLAATMVDVFSSTPNVGGRERVALDKDGLVYRMKEKECAPALEHNAWQFESTCSFLLNQPNRRVYYKVVAKVLRECARTNTNKGELESMNEFEDRGAQRLYATALTLLKEIGDYRLAAEIFAEATDRGEVYVDVKAMKDKREFLQNEAEYLTKKVETGRLSGDVVVGLDVGSLGIDSSSSLGRRDTFLPSYSSSSSKGDDVSQADDVSLGDETRPPSLGSTADLSFLFETSEGDNNGKKVSNTAFSESFSDLGTPKLTPEERKDSLRAAQEALDMKIKWDLAEKASILDPSNLVKQVIEAKKRSLIAKKLIVNEKTGVEVQLESNGSYIHWTNLHHTPAFSVGPRGFLEEKPWWTGDDRLQKHVKIMGEYIGNIRYQLDAFLDAREKDEKWARDEFVPFDDWNDHIVSRGQYTKLHLVDKKYYRRAPCNAFTSIESMLSELRPFNIRLPYSHYNTEECALVRFTPGTKVQLHNGGSNLRVTIAMGIKNSEKCFVYMGASGEEEFSDGACMAWAEGWDHAFRYEGKEDCWLLTLGVMHPRLVENKWIFSRAGYRTAFEVIDPTRQKQYAEFLADEEERLRGGNPDEKYHAKQKGGFSRKIIPDMRKLSATKFDDVAQKTDSV